MPCSKLKTIFLRREGREKATTGVRTSYMRVVGIQLDSEGLGSLGCSVISSEEESTFRRLAALPNIYERLATSIAPSIYGSADIKKAIACLLFGGSRKRLPDGLTRRGDINILLLGDPGTAKSQLLKFVEKVAPIAVYTSGKGSSAAGLTASVMRDPATVNIILGACQLKGMCVFYGRTHSGRTKPTVEEISRAIHKLKNHKAKNRHYIQNV
uniref:DNA replication licensing factor Mcm5-like n=1 Tax=Diabrotica virgifera virgifera TaxID=50390 RepID=A0A6P7GKM2_DIAVI